MSEKVEAWTRADWALWFLQHDEVDEAARVLEAGDELVLGKSDYLDLAAALSRRGLSATYELRRVTVLRPERAQKSPGEAGAADSRRPPLRATAVRATPAKKTG
jgi:hypothetical protein